MNRIFKKYEEQKQYLKTHKDAVFAFPTDTVWGLGCLIESKQGVERIYSIKHRDRRKPLILLSNKIEYLEPYVDKMPELAVEWSKKYWPGALTLVVKKSKMTPDYMTSGFDTVGIRIPDNKDLLDFLEQCVETHAIATTSANISGNNSSITKEEVISSIGDKIDFITDGEDPDKKFESTVVAVYEDNTYKILRQGYLKL